ncbi:sugar transporter, partial [Streptomyces sp. TRM76130]|nr:sugar transporter [Streptomyces sp. TRM76130]
MKRKLISAIGVAGMMVSAAACGGDSGDSESGAEGRTLTVWVMDGSSPDQWQKELGVAFEKRTGSKVEFEVQ